MFPISRRAPRALVRSLAPLMMVVAASQAGAQSAQAGGCGGASDAATPAFGVMVDDTCYDLSYLLNPGSMTGTWNSSANVLLGGAPFAFLASYDSDPFVDFSLTTMNLLSTPTTFTFLFGTPVVPGFYAYATSNLTATVTGTATAAGSIALSPSYSTYLAGTGFTGVVETNLGVDIGTAACSSSGLVATVCTYGPGTNTFAPTFFDALQARVSYVQSGQGSSVTISGRVEILAEAPATTVPEPGTYALMLTGLAVTSVLLRRRRRI